MTDIALLSHTKYVQYVNDVLSGKETACLYVRLACQRFVDDLRRPDLDFCPDKVDRVIKFFRTLRHFKGKHKGKPFVLRPWQEFIVANLYGWYRWVTDEDTGERYYTRRFHKAYIEMARKQGKSALAAGCALYQFCFDGEDGAECVLAANSREQAKIVLNLCTGFVKSLDPRGKTFHLLRNEIEYKKKMSVLKVVSADSTKLDGFECSFYEQDEYHAAINSKLYDVLQSSTGTRVSPMGMVITTAGFNLDGPCAKMREVNTEILRGLKQDDNQFAIIYTLDEADDWKDETTWKKVAPNLGVTVTRDYMRGEVQAAINDPSKEVGVKTKTFNIWCHSEEVWIPEEYVLDGMIPFDFSRWRGENVWIGVDLSSVSDLTAINFLFHNIDTDTFYNQSYVFLPEESIKTKQNRDKYQEWVREGHLLVTPGNVVDYDFILDLIQRTVETYDLALQAIAYDSWNATQFAINGTQLGFPMQPFGQSIGNFSKPTKEVERRLLQKTWKMNYSPITRWCFANVSIRTDANQNEKPIKTQDAVKIDIVIAQIMSLGGWMVTQGYASGGAAAVG